MSDTRDKPELETLGYNPNNANCAIGCECAKCTGDAEQTLEQPNQNLMIIEEIEGLMSQIDKRIWKLMDNKSLSDKQTEETSTAVEEIDLFQKTTLFELRRCFE